MANRILFFTMHRSGSTHAHRTCLALAQACGIPYTSPNPGASRHTPVREMAERSDFWIDATGCFGPLRFYFDVPGHQSDRILLQLRDPRDVLTSMFYSYCFSHAGEIAGDTGYRRQWAQRGLDDFVLQMAHAEQAPIIGDYGTGGHLWDLAGNVLTRYERYLDHLVGQPNVTLASYEQMALEPEAWLKKLAAVFDPARCDELAQAVAAALSSARPPVVENQWSHKRIVAPGDHRQKLAAATIQRLNVSFGQVLSRLGYCVGCDP